jgi:hypothetical protein
LESRKFNGNHPFLTYNLEIRFYPYERDMKKMLPIIKKSNRVMQIGTMYIPVTFEFIDQVFSFEAYTGRIIGISRFPQPIYEEGWRVVIDMNNKRWKLEDYQNW